MNRKIVPLLLIIGLGITGLGYYFYIQKSPCEEPIGYKLGTVDPRFGVTESDFKTDIIRASNIWSGVIDTPLFIYDPRGALTISLVYDILQQTTQKENVLTTQIAQTSQTADSIKQQYSALKTEYQIAERAYTEQVAQFNAAQDSYNKQVSYWNGQGGAPGPEYKKLTAEKDALLAERDALEEKRQQVNELASQINAFIDKYNLLVSHINADVNAINNDGLAGTQFEEGVYISDASGTRIVIYQFGNKIDLIRVLAHELGHALDLAHNTNPNSIMNPVNESDTLTLSPEDLRDLKAQCGLK